MSDRRKVGVIGAGLISQAMHLPHLALLRDRFELAVVADPSRTVRERVGDRFGIPARVATASEAIAHPGLHGVVVGTPNATHASIVLEALAAGLDVFVEKPLAISLEDVDAIVEAQRSLRARRPGRLQQPVRPLVRAAGLGAAGGRPTGCGT